METYILIAILAVGALIRLPIFKFPIDDDLGYFAYAPWFRRRGVRLGIDIYTRLPMHWLYSLAFALFGRKPHSPKILDVLFELLTAAAIYTLCAVTLTDAAGLVAAAFYLLFSNSASVGLFSGCNERYYSIFVAAGFLLLLKGYSSPPADVNIYFFASGCFLAASFYFKDVLVVNGAGAAAALLLIRSEPLDPLLWLGGGFLLVGVVIYIPLIQLNGGLPAFIKLSWEGYKRALQDNPDRGSTNKLLVNSGWFFLEVAPLAVIPLLHIFTFGANLNDAATVVLAAWLVSTAAVFFIQGVYWPYHFIAFIPPLSVISAFALIRFFAEQSGMEFETRLLWWSALAASFAISGFLQIKTLINGSDPKKQSGNYTWSKLEQITAVPKIAEYIRQRTTEGDYIYQWGYLYHLYLLTDRLCPVYGCISLAPPAKEWQLEVLKNIVDSLIKTPPKFIIINIQRIDMTVLEQLTGLRYELEKIFSKGLRVYGLVESGVSESKRELTASALEELLADADVPFQLGMALLESGDKKGAKEKFDEALSINPAHVGVLFALAKIAFNEARYEEAEKIYVRLAEWDDRQYRLDSVYELLKLYTETDNRKGVESVMLSLEKRGEQADPVIAYLLGRFFIKQNSPEKALDIYLNVKPSAQTVTNKKFYGAMEYHAGKIFFDKGDYEKAIYHLELCLKIEPAHSKAEALLAEARNGKNPVIVKKVLMFACAPAAAIGNSLDTVKKDFPGCKIILVALKKTDPAYERDPRIDKVLTLPFNSFWTAMLLTSSTRKLLASVRADAAVIPSALPSLSHNAITYLNLLLYATLAFPKRIYFYKSPYFNRREVSLITSVRVVLRKVYETLLLPFWLSNDLYDLWRQSGEKKVACLSPEPNDLIAHNVKAQWITRNSINGVSFNSYMGNPYSLYYPWLSLWLLGHLGAVGFMILQTAVFGFSAAAAGVLSGNAWFILFVPHLLSSYYFRLSTIYVGRLDFLSWGFVLASMTAFHAGHPLIAALFFSAAVMGHTTVSLLGGIGILILALTTGKLFPQFLVMVPITMALTFSWWYPFLKNRGRFAFHRVWNEIGFVKNNYLSYIWPFRNLTIVIAAALLVVDVTAEQLLILTPWLIYLFGITQKKYLLHTDNLTASILVFGTFALLLNPSWELALLFFILINSVDALDNPRINPIFEEPFLTQAGELFKPVAKNRRLALECNPASYWDDNMCWGWLFNMAANRFGFQMLAGVGFDQVDPLLPLDYETKINNDTDTKKLKAILMKSGCGYVASYTVKFAATLETMGFSQIGKKKFSSFGFLKEREWTLYRASFETELIEPPVKWALQKNSLRFKPNGAKNYRVKLAYYPGWEAEQNKKKLAIKNLSPGMEVTVDGESEVLMKYKVRLF